MVASIPEHVEIERRFLVDGRGAKPWREAETQYAIQQHYAVAPHLALEGHVLSCDGVAVATLTEEQVVIYRQTDAWVSRLRQRNEAWFLTYKSRLTSDSAYELEWEITASAAQTLLRFGPFPCVEKTRYVWPDADGFLWEIDEFEGGLAGLVLAEIELEHSEQNVVVPDWMGQEITGLSSWSNRALAETLASRMG